MLNVSLIVNLDYDGNLYDDGLFMKYLPLDKRNQKYQPYKQFLPGCEFSAMSWWLLCSTFDNFLRPTETT